MRILLTKDGASCALLFALLVPDDRCKYDRAERDSTVSAKLKRWTALVALIFLSHALMAQNALAVTAEIARKCGDLADKAYPPRVPGNPAAGHLNGTSQDVQDYFNKCVANGGRVPDRQAPQETK